MYIILQDTTTKQSAAVIRDDISFLHTPRTAYILVKRTLRIVYRNATWPKGKKWVLQPWGVM